jgi:hypothetical protein
MIILPNSGKRGYMTEVWRPNSKNENKMNLKEQRKKET